MTLKIICVSSLKTLALEVMTEKCFPGLPITYIVAVTESGALLLRNLRNTRSVSLRRWLQAIICRGLTAGAGAAAALRLWTRQLLLL